MCISDFYIATMGAKLKCLVVVVIVICLNNVSGGKSKKDHPPHCTIVTKDTDYQSKYRFDYKPAYLIPGQREAFQTMFCLNPPTVNKAVTVVCDWVAPPMVQFTIGDEHVHVMRVDPTGRFLGNAVITTYQLCNHNLHSVNESELVISDL